MRGLTAAVVLISTLAGSARAQPEPTPQAPPPMPSVTLPPELDRVLRDYEKQWQARSAAGLAALFMEDGFVLQGGKLPVRGKEAIEQAYRAVREVVEARAAEYVARFTSS